jgi:hypothetical protein
MESNSTVKKLKTSAGNAVVGHPVHLQMPKGTVWSNNSCAYDCVFSIMHSIWSNNHVRHSELFRSINNNFLTFLAEKFSQHQRDVVDLEDIRDDLRRLLANEFPITFPWGEYVGIDIGFHTIFKTPNVVLSSVHMCPNGHAVQ